MAGRRTYGRTTESNKVETMNINKPASPLPSLECHLMPCEIKYNGNTIIEHYFKPRKEVEAGARDNSVHYSASFRGRLLQGKELILPDNFKGFVLEQTEQNETDNLTCTNQCGKITYWNWDKTPSANDSTVKMIDWLSISHSVHADE